MTLHRDSASPIDLDAIGAIDFDGEDDGSNQTTFARIHAIVEDVTSATEDGALVFSTVRAGTLTEAARIDSAGAMRVSDGTAGTPSLAFKDDPDTGLFREATEIGFAFGGSQTFAVSSTGQALANTGSATTPSYSFASDLDTGLFRADTNDLGVSTGGIEAARFDQEQHLLLGHTIGVDQGSKRARLQIHGLTTNDAAISLAYYGANAGSDPRIIFARSRGTSLGSSDLVQSGDVLGRIIFAAGDGVDLNSQAANINVIVDGTPNANDMPGKLSFATTPSGASAPVAALSIDSSQTVQFAASGSWIANGSGSVTIGNVAPSGVGTATIGKWLKVKDDVGTEYFIPAWT